MVSKSSIRSRDWEEVDPEYPFFQIAAWRDEHGNRLIAEKQPGPYGDGWRVFYETHKEDTPYGGEVVTDVPDEEAARQAASSLATAK